MKPIMETATIPAINRYTTSREVSINFTEPSQAVDAEMERMGGRVSLRVVHKLPAFRLA